MRVIDKNPRPPNGDDLWDRYFLVRMLYLHSRDVNQLKKFGMRVSGVESIDRYLDKQEIVTELNIDAMFEKWRSGVTIRLVNYNDAAEVYRIIHSHLVAWAEYIQTGVNVGAAPIKDLIELDEFANVVYDKAVNVFSIEAKQHILSNNFMNIQSLNFRNILKKAPTEAAIRVTPRGDEVMTVTKVDEQGLPERSSLKDLFAEQMATIGTWRGD